MLLIQLLIEQIFCAKATPTCTASGPKGMADRHAPAVSATATAQHDAVATAATRHERSAVAALARGLLLLVVARQRHALKPKHATQVGMPECCGVTVGVNK